MFCISLPSDDPFINLAIEEILLKKSKEEYLILGINYPSVIIGKHQSAHKEANTKFLTEKNIPVIRRISGGGTVFHDKGNLNFTFIRQSEPGKQVDFHKHTRPVIDFLLSLGVDARFEGKSDIKVGGFKISGNAEHVYRDRILHHGTLLFSSSLRMLQNCIRKDKSCYSTRAVDSNTSSVMNLNEILRIFPDIYEFRKEMLYYFLKKIKDTGIYELSGKETDEALSLAETKYRSWEWNYAYGPVYSFKNSFQLEGILHWCNFFVRDGIITECTIEGSGQMIPVAKRLTGCPHMVADMLKVFKEENVSISNEEIFSFF